MATGRSTAGRDAQKAELAAKRATKRPTPSDSPAVGPSHKRRKVDAVSSKHLDDASEWQESADDEGSTSAPATSKPKAGKRTAKGKGKAPAPVKRTRQPRPKMASGPSRSVHWMSNPKKYPFLPGSFKFVPKDKGESARKILNWRGERMYEKLLLNMYYECGKMGVEVPWDKIAHRVEPGTTKDAIHQAMERLRQTVLAEGHMVPPEIGIKDNWTRGFTRVYPDSFEDADILYCRPVGWLDDIEHPKEKNPSSERLTFNGQHKFVVEYQKATADIPAEWVHDRGQRRSEVRLSSNQAVTRANVLAAEQEDQLKRERTSSSSAAVDENDDQQQVQYNISVAMSSMLRSREEFYDSNDDADADAEVDNETPLITSSPPMPGQHFTSGAQGELNAQVNVPNNAPKTSDLTGSGVTDSQGVRMPQNFTQHMPKVPNPSLAYDNPMLPQATPLFDLEDLLMGQSDQHTQMASAFGGLFPSSPRSEESKAAEAQQATQAIHGADIFLPQMDDEEAAQYSNSHFDDQWHSQFFGI
ncbi:heterokaryon incompatibility protein-domain-containing protein [Apiospora arundinis]